MPANVADLPLHQRDLDWSICGPALLDCDWSPARPLWLQAPCAQRSWLRQAPPLPFRSNRLGLRFEQLWQQFLSLQGWRYAANLAIRQHGRTLGEIDLLLETPGQTLHLELALKFYLGTAQGWIGTDPRDRLCHKIARLQQHQLPLSQDPGVRTQLAALGWQPQQRQAVVRGCLFYPAHDLQPASLPDIIHTGHWRGYWCYSREAEHWLPEGDWARLEKPHWLSPAYVSAAGSRTQLLEHVRSAAQQRAVCVVRGRAHGTGYAEQERWLLLPDHWPAQPA